MHVDGDADHTDGLGPERAAGAGTFSGRVISAVRWQALDQGVQQVLRLAVMVVLANLLAPDAFGLVAIALVVTELATLLSTMGMGSAIVQRKDLTQRHVSVAFTLTTSLGLLAALVVNTAAPALAGFFGEPELEAVLRVLSISFLCKGIHAVPLDLLRRELQFSQIMVMSTAATVLAGTAAVTAALMGAGVWALVALSVGEAAAALVAVWMLTIRAGLFSPRLSFDRRAARDLFAFGAYVSGVQLLYFGQGNVDNLIVGRVLGASALGYYSVAYRLMLLPITRIADVISVVAFPAFSTIQDDLARLRNAFLRGVRTIALVCFPLSIGTAIAASILVELVFGTEWLPAVPIVQILALNGPRLAVNRLGGAVLLARGEARANLVVSLISFALYVLGFVIGVQFGIQGVAWGFTIAGHVATPVGLVVTARSLDTTTLTLLRAAVPATASTAVMAAAATGALAATEGIWLVPRLVLVAGAGAAGYAVAVRVGWPGTLTGLGQDLFRRAGKPAVSA